MFHCNIPRVDLMLMSYTYRRRSEPSSTRWYFFPAACSRHQIFSEICPQSVCWVFCDIRDKNAVNQVCKSCGMWIEDWELSSYDWELRIADWRLRTASHLLVPQSSVFISFETKKNPRQPLASLQVFTSLLYTVLKQSLQFIPPLELNGQF